MAENTRNRNSGGAGAVADQPKADEDKDKAPAGNSDASPKPDKQPGDGSKTADNGGDTKPDDKDKESEKDGDDEDDEDDESERHDGEPVEGGTIEGVEIVHGPTESVPAPQAQAAPNADGTAAQPDEKKPGLTLAEYIGIGQKALKDMGDDDDTVSAIDKATLTELVGKMEELIDLFGGDKTPEELNKKIVTGVVSDLSAAANRFFTAAYQARLGSMANTVSAKWNATDENNRLLHTGVAGLLRGLLDEAAEAGLRGLPEGRLVIAITPNSRVITTWVPDGLAVKRASPAGAARGTDTPRRGRPAAGEGPIEYTAPGAQPVRMSGSEALEKLYELGSKTAKHAIDTLENAARDRGQQGKINRLLYARKAIESEGWGQKGFRLLIDAA